MMKKTGWFFVLEYLLLGTLFSKAQAKHQASQHHKNEDITKQPKGWGIKRMKPADLVIMLHFKVSQTSIPIQR